MSAYRKGNKYDWHFFWLYKIGDKYILEGNDFETVEDFVEFNEKNHNFVDDEFSIV